MRVFVDTNLWVYRLDHGTPDKAAYIRDWLRAQARENEIVISTQVMIELRSVLTRKLRPPISWRDTQSVLESISQFEVVGSNASLVMDAHVLARAQKLSWFDALIVEAAIRSGCERLYSEDLGHERRYGKLTVLNPFA